MSQRNGQSGIGLRIWRLVPGLLLVLCASGIVWAQSSVVTEKSLVYCTHGDVLLRLDVAYLPIGSAMRPGLVFLPGNGWGHWGGAGYDRYEYSNAIKIAAAHGYVAAAVEYRSSNAGQCQYPAQLLDVRSALRWLRANHERFGLNPDRVGAVGWSSGGHLALLLGLLDGAPRPDEVDNLQYSSKVQAVVSLAGPTELSMMYKEATYPGIPAALAELMGGSPDQLPQRYQEASPLYQVNTDSSPMLLIQGDQDTEVPPNEVSLFLQKARDVGANATLILVKGMGHENAYNHAAVLPFLDGILMDHR